MLTAFFVLSAIGFGLIIWLGLHWRGAVLEILLLSVVACGTAFSISRMPIIIRSMRNVEPKLEIFDHCAIDLRYFRDWILWEDVTDIFLTRTGRIEVMTPNKSYYDKAVPTSICGLYLKRTIFRDNRMPLSFSAHLLDCSFWELLFALRQATRPYNIPIRVVDSD